MEKNSFHYDEIKELFQWYIFYDKFIYNFTIEDYKVIDNYEYRKFELIFIKLEKNVIQSPPSTPSPTSSQPIHSSASSSSSPSWMTPPTTITTLNDEAPDHICAIFYQCIFYNTHLTTTPPTTLSRKMNFLPNITTPLWMTTPSRTTTNLPTTPSRIMTFPSKNTNLNTAKATTQATTAIHTAHSQVTTTTIPTASTM